MGAQQTVSDTRVMIACDVEAASMCVPRTLTFRHERPLAVGRQRLLDRNITGSVHQGGCYFDTHELLNTRSGQAIDCGHCRD
jgi:hypothetical protein